MLVFNGGQKNKGELREKPFGAKTQLRFYSIESNISPSSKHFTNSDWREVSCRGKIGRAKYTRTLAFCPLDNSQANLDLLDDFALTRWLCLFLLFSCFFFFSLPRSGKKCFGFLL